MKVIPVQSAAPFRAERDRGRFQPRGSWLKKLWQQAPA
jgi:hypothetical protein